MATRLQKAIPKIKLFFDEQDAKIYKQRDLTNILHNNQDDGWKLPLSLKTAGFIRELVDNTPLRKVVLQPANQNQALTRYIWKEASPYEVALSLKPGSYLCHGTAVFLHGLNDQIPRTIYVNKEQSKKPVSKNTITQSGIDKAFAGKQRTSLYEFNYKNHRILLLNGKSTDRLEVIAMKGPEKESLEVTGIERTLIDIAVRPAYAGGVYQVLAAYEGAMERVSMNTVTALLRKLGYSYPYHQAIGFYMKKAGYPKKSTERLKKFGLDFDFYLDYGIKERNRSYDEEWRLFYPKGL